MTMVRPASSFWISLQLEIVTVKILNLRVSLQLRHRLQGQHERRSHKLTWHVSFTCCSRWLLMFLHVCCKDVLVNGDFPVWSPGLLESWFDSFCAVALLNNFILTLMAEGEFNPGIWLAHLCLRRKTGTEDIVMSIEKYSVVLQALFTCWSS